MKGGGRDRQWVSWGGGGVDSWGGGVVRGSLDN